MSPNDTPGSQLTERYLLGDLLGAGGAATVYRATHRRSGQPVAIKMFTTPPEPDRPVRRGEDAALEQLRHPGLVEIHETGTDTAGHRYLVMQLIDGEDLTRRIERGPMPVHDVTTIGTALADTLAHVHEQGVVHRDIKPGNILLDHHLRPYLTDFGVSRLIDATRVTATGAAVGTPAYMAPEQVRGRKVGPPADVYALGLVLLEAITGQREYPGTVVESAVARLHRRPIIPSPLPTPLRTLLAAMTADQPQDRPSAGTVARRLATDSNMPLHTSAAVTTTAEDHAHPPRRSPNRQAIKIAALVAAAGLATALLGGGAQPDAAGDSALNDVRPPATATPPTPSPPSPLPDPQTSTDQQLPAGSAPDQHQASPPDPQPNIGHNSSTDDTVEQPVSDVRERIDPVDPPDVPSQEHGNQTGTAADDGTSERPSNKGKSEEKTAKPAKNKNSKAGQK